MSGLENYCGRCLQEMEFDLEDSKHYYGPVEEMDTLSDRTYPEAHWCPKCEKRQALNSAAYPCWYAEQLKDLSPEQMEEGDPIQTKDGLWGFLNENSAGRVNIFGPFPHKHAAELYASLTRAFGCPKDVPDASDLFTAMRGKGSIDAPPTDEEVKRTQLWRRTYRDLEEGVDENNILQARLSRAFEMLEKETDSTIRLRQLWDYVLFEKPVPA